MTLDILVKTFPKLYHVAHVNAWESIRKHGLLSTSALLKLFAVNHRDRERIESARRPKCVNIEHPLHGRAVIRDNKPMSDGGLRRCLEGMTPVEWYRLLNRKVFFWLSEDRLQTFLQAYAHENHCVLTISTSALISRHAARTWLSPMNSGCTTPFAHPRGPNTFKRIIDYPFEHSRKKKGGAKKAVVEFAVDRGIPDIRDFVESVTIRNSTGVISSGIRGRKH